MEINKMFSAERCWDMVNRIPASTDRETLRRCSIAERWLRNNEVITEVDFFILMDAVKSYRAKANEKDRKRHREFHATEGSTENPREIRFYYDQQRKMGLSPSDECLTVVERNMLAYGDETIYRDPDGFLWRDYFSIGD